ncbi:MAG TPA: hypothetical protein VGL03_10690 [Thermoanaerobaculia bacterium]
MNPVRRESRRFVPLIAAAILTFVGIARLPFDRGFWPTSTPFDRWPSPDAATDFGFLVSVCDAIPAHASVLVMTEPPDLDHDFYLYAYAVALLPGRRVLPASMWNASTRPEMLPQADFLVVLGRRPDPPPGALVRETPAGTVWRR